MNFNKNNSIQVSSIISNDISHDNHNDSIINQLNLLDNGCTYESRVVKIQSFIYTQQPQTPQSPYNHLHNSFLHDQQGNIIPAISSKYLPYNPSNSPRSKISKPFDQIQDLKYKNSTKNAKMQQKLKGKKSIREQIMQQNKILEHRLNLNKNNIYAFSTDRYNKNNLKGCQQLNFISTKALPKEQKQIEQKQLLESKIDEQILSKLQQQYNKSKIIKMYNFIMKQLPKCKYCQEYSHHLMKQGNGVEYGCKQCNSSSNMKLHPIIGILYDLENKGRFQEQLNIYQSILDKITNNIQNLQQQIIELQKLKQKIIYLKNINRKKYKQINQSKFYLKKYITNLKQSHLIQLKNLIPKQYLQQIQIWNQLKNNNKKIIQNKINQIYKLIPIFLHNQINSKLLNNLHKILNYQKQQEVKISISQHIKFPIKRIDSATFIVDGSYNLPIFENIKHLNLQFQNKKTLRQLTLLFTNLPRQIYSLSLNYNHKIHSHISAQNFTFFKYTSSIPSIKKLNLKIQNIKQFNDLLQISNNMTPKIQIKLIITKHIFSKNILNLPQNYYISLINKLGSNITKIQIDLPQSIDSPAIINYQQLINLKYLTIFKINRKQKDINNINNEKILSSLNISQKQKKYQIIFKKLICKKINFIQIIKKYKYNITIIKSILSLLI